MTQQSLLDDDTLQRRILDKAEAGRQTEAGVRRVRKRLVDPEALEWRARALEALRTVARRQAELTGDDVWQQLGEVDERYAAAMGPIFRMAAKAGAIASTGRFAESTRPSRHRCGIRVWRSLIQSGR